MDGGNHVGTKMQSKHHWEQVYASKPAESVSWYQPHANLSLKLIEGAGLPVTAALIDVGGGASTLVDDLLERGFRDVTVLDVAASALESAKARLGHRAARVHWLEADVTKVDLPGHAYDVWHDRAVFHFLTDPEDRRAYVEAVLRAIKPGGHVIIATFAEDGPLKCSGLPVMRYSAAALHAELGSGFALVAHERELHHTPFGTTQQFTYCCFRKPGA